MAKRTPNRDHLHCNHNTCHRKIVRMIMQYPAILLLLAGVVSANSNECTSPLRLYESEAVSGDNSLADSDFNDMDACGPNSHQEGVWYEIIGTGEEITLNVCSENERILSVGFFSACNSQSCLGFPPGQLKQYSCENNEYLSYQFFAERDRSYRVHVRANVIKFPTFTLGAEFKIFYRTSTPTASPTTSFPTIASATPAPTSAPFTTLPTEFFLPTFGPYRTSNCGKVSSCLEPPPKEYRIQNEKIEFDYTLSKTSLNAAGTASEIEGTLHRLLSERLLKCIFDEESYTIVEISIGDRDRVSATSCTAQSSGSACSVVNGRTDMVIAFPEGRRRLNDELYRDLIPIFRETLLSLGGELQGFRVSDDELGDDENDEDDGSVPSSLADEPKSESSLVLLILGIIVGVLVLIIGLLFMRRKLRHQKFRKRLEGVQTLDLDEDVEYEVGSPAHEVDDRDVTEDEQVQLFEKVILETEEHDFRSCGNPDCKHCLPSSFPTFVSTESGEQFNQTRTKSLNIQSLAYNDGWASFDRRKYLRQPPQRKRKVPDITWI